MGRRAWGPEKGRGWRCEVGRKPHFGEPASASLVLWVAIGGCTLSVTGRQAPGIRGAVASSWGPFPLYAQARAMCYQLLLCSLILKVASRAPPALEDAFVGLSALRGGLTPTHSAAGWVPPLPPGSVLLWEIPADIP